MRFGLPNCLGATSAPRHAHEELSTDSDSLGAAPTNPLFSAFDFGGGRASDLSFTETGDGDVNLIEDEGYNVKNGISLKENYRENIEY